MWVTNGDESSKLQYMGSLSAWSDPGPGPVFAVNPEDPYETIRGFGAAISNSAAHNLYNVASDRQAVLQSLFHPVDGIGISWLRLVMGGSDFNAVPPYTYDDAPPGEEDFDFQYFSIDKDRDFVLPLLAEILAINPEIGIVASPWSPPAWMKTSESLNGGELKSGVEYEDALARYFVLFLQAYADEGITIEAITLQNEPEHTSNGYPTMWMTSETQNGIIRDHLGPMLQQEGLSTEIWVWDHNWDNTGYSMDILDDPVTRQYVSGSAWHCYAGDRNDPAIVKEAHPDKDLHFSECSGGEWDTNFASVLGWNVENLFTGQTRIGARTVLLWNMALDENHGPREGVTAGCTDCRGVVTVNTGDGSFEENVEYYACGHFSKFVESGSSSIAVDPVNNDWVDVSAFLNPDGTVVFIALNSNWDEDRDFNVQLDADYYRYNLQPRSVATIII